MMVDGGDKVRPPVNISQPTPLATTCHDHTASRILYILEDRLERLGYLHARTPLKSLPSCPCPSTRMMGLYTDEAFTSNLLSQKFCISNIQISAKLSPF